MKPGKYQYIRMAQRDMKGRTEFHNQGRSPLHGQEKGWCLLTAQEKRVLELLAHAQTNKEIAAALGVSPCTVKRHLENILRKLNLKNRVHAAIFAVRNGHGEAKPSAPGEAA